MSYIFTTVVFWLDVGVGVAEIGEVVVGVSVGAGVGELEFDGKVVNA